VVFTMLGLGLLVHWMIPAISLPVAFALAAVVSPTDPVAISAITDRISAPRRLQHVLEGESLLNDATGLVCFRFAVVAVMTGSFSLSSAALAFTWVAAGGVMIGACLSFLIILAKLTISRHFGEEPGSQVLLSLLIPFAAYQAAEHLQCSGILAAVSAGITMSYMELSGQARGVTRVQRAAVWDTVQFALNGVMFVLLGEQLPQILDGAATAVRQSEHVNPLWLIAYVLTINLILAALRFIWVFASLWVTALAARWRQQSVPKVGFRMTAALSLAGVRGALTLAGVLTLPFALPDGSPFPARDLAIFLAAGVIIFSLLAANVFLPHLLRGLDVPPESARERAIDRARARGAAAAIAAIERAQHDLAEARGNAELYALAAERAADAYQRRLQGLADQGESSRRARRAYLAEQELRLIALRAERDTVFALARENEIADDDSRRLIRELDLMEERLRYVARTEPSAEGDPMRRI
jgi:CPA1 family monovalent cation:H+ antiporter